MKKLMLAFTMVTAALLTGSPQAQASEAAGCIFHFKVKLRSTVIFQSGGGRGYLECKDVDGRESRSHVNIDVDGLGLGLGVFEFEGVSGNLGFLDARELEGQYYIADANIAVIVGGGLSLGLYNQRNGLSIDAKIKAGRGLGAAINGSRWTITLAEQQRR